MNHQFGELLTQYRIRKRGLSQARLAQIVGYDPAVIARMAQGTRDLTGPSGRERVVRIIAALRDEGVMRSLDEANALLAAADMPPLYDGLSVEAALIKALTPASLLANTSMSAATPRYGATHNLPALLTSFIGREQEIAELTACVRTTRLVTSLGPPGVGKTRLAIEVAHQACTDFDDGAWFVPLAPITDPELVVTTMAQALGITLTADLPSIESVKRFLHDKRLLLVLDNFEQVLEAAPLVSEILAAAPKVKVLVTSRAALHLSGEHEFEVQPLATPPAIELFVQRAQAIKANFALSDDNISAVADICRRLDGLPLAIELAAVRVKLFSPQALLARLSNRLDILTDGARDLAARQRTLRSTIDWSYNLLTPDEQVVFRRLGVFVNGWTLEAAERVAGSPDLSASVANDLQSLIDKSLVKQKHTMNSDSDMRFGMLETLREYALDRLEESGEAEVVRQRHAEYFVELAERVKPNMNSAERKVWYTRFDAEQDNFRAALAWALATGHAELGLRLAGALGEYRYWWAGGWLEGWSWISQLLALPQARQPKRARATALKAAVNFLRYLGDNAQANRHADESLALYRELGDKTGMAWVLVDKGCDAWARADYTQAKTLCDESDALFREVGDPRGQGWAMNWLAAVARDQGKVEEAFRLFDAALTALRQAGDDTLAANVHLGLTDLAHRTGDYARADVLARQAMALKRESGDLDGANYALVNLARIALAQGDLDRAASQFEASEAWFRQAQQRRGLCWVLYQLGYVRHLQGDDDTASALLREALTLQRQQQLALLLTESLERCACITADMHQPQRAARLFGAAEAARERIGAPLPLGDRPLYDRHLAQARADLDETTFDAAWAEGRAMTLDEAVEYALDTVGTH